MIKRSLIATVVLAGLLSLSAEAGFEYRQPVTQTVSDVVCANPGIVEVGTALESQRYMVPAAGFGEDVPLRTALEALAPTGWTIAYQDVPATLNVSWRGEKAANWSDTVRVIARNHGLCVITDYTRAQLLVSSIQQSANGVRVASTGAAAQSSAIAGATSEPTSVGARPLAVAAPSWTVSAGQTVREVLEAWADMSGWQLVYEPEHDYRIAARAQFDGTFESAVGELITTMHRGGSDLGAQMYAGNRVVRIVQIQ